MNAGFSFSDWTSKSWAGGLVIALHVVFALVLLQTRSGVAPVNAEPIKVTFIAIDRPVTPEPQPQPQQLAVSLELPKSISVPVPEVSVEREFTPVVATPMTASASTPLAKSASTGPILVSEVEYLREPTLRYPAVSRRLREQGTVVLRVLVDESGHAAQIEIHQSSGFPRLDEAACRALREAQFKPYVYEGRKQAALVMVPIEFSLRV